MSQFYKQKVCFIEVANKWQMDGQTEKNMPQTNFQI